MNVAHELLAKKYAKAFINLFSDHISDEVADRIYTLSRYLVEHRRALFYVQLTKLDGDATKKNFDDLFMRFGVDHIFSPLIDMLLEAKRIFLIPRIMYYIYHLYLEKRNSMFFTIESSVPLTDDELSVLRTFLENKTGKNILYHVKLNPDLIAGVKMYSNTRYFEQSIRNYVRTLSTTL
ncbi:F0F1 ATP synthase subunit delta [Candidatus Dependentiae bacterium]|nr:F0F1 ATP synthase subunit delta [Candidatus Dependentiae bacterium]